MSTLIVTLNPPSTASTELAYCLVSSVQSISSHGSAALALLPKSDSTVLLVPSTVVSWHAVTLPKLARSTSAQKLRAVLDGLLEEHVLDDTAQLHIALYRPSGSTEQITWAVACDKAWLLEQVRSLQAAGHSISRIVPEAFPVPAAASDDAGSLHISGSPEAAMATLVDATGVMAVPLAQARAVWPAWSENYQPTITAEPAVAAMAEATLHTKVSIVQSAQRALQSMLDASNQGLDLAQGDLAVAGRGRWMQIAGGILRDLAAAPAWRMARWGAALMVVANLVGLNVWAWKERSVLQTKRGQTSQILAQAFPQVKVIVDAPVQMQRELTQLRQASGALAGRDFESMFARFASAANLSVAPSAVEFIAGEISLKGTGLGASQLSQLQSKLQAAGLTARSEGDRVIIGEWLNQRVGGAL
jgi:general secretion pathway protein L